MDGVKALYEKFMESTGVSTDTRTLQTGELFFALSGPNFNGNLFARNALQAGASYAVIDDPQVATNDRFILVEDVLAALQALARHHRRTFHIPFIGITGSNGKTTCKELTREILRMQFRVHATEGNLNNHIGVPLTLLSMPRDTQIAIIEMGANKIGDIAELCSIAEPTHGFITNIGKAHLEGFGGIEGVLRGKSELYHWLIQNQGYVFVNENDATLFNMSKRFQDDKVLTFPGKKSYRPLEFTKADPFVCFRSANGKEQMSNLAGEHHFNNIAVALTLGKYFGVSNAEAEKAAAEYVPDNNRSQLVYRGDTTILLDAYNANPSSMEAALANLNAMGDEPKVVVLGDMLELGEEGPDEHRSLAEYVKALAPQKVLLVGPLMEHLAEELPHALTFTDKKTLVEWVKENPFGKATVLVKGSRSMGLEAILDAIPLED